MGYGFAPQQVVPTQTMIPPADQNNMNMASFMNQSMMMQPQMAQPTKNINMAYAAIKECVQKIQALGFNVNTEDFDFENMYQNDKGAYTNHVREISVIAHTLGASVSVDVTKYGVIYGGVQKNVGPAGVTFVIIRKDLLGKSGRKLQSMVDYATHYPEEARNHSMYNTPPVFPIFVMYQTLKWVKELGGVEVMYKMNKEKAELLYNEIDRNSMFVGTAAKEDRSLMNVCFVMAPGYEELQDEFMNFAKERGMVGIKGHRSVGGFRASIYNACPVESVKALVACMQEFEESKK